MLEKLNILKPFESFLEYPKDYNPRVHGPYNPAKYYGKPDLAFGDVKIADLASWIGRREKSLSSIGNMFSRGNFKI